MTKEILYQSLSLSHMLVILNLPLTSACPTYTNMVLKGALKRKKMRLHVSFSLLKCVKKLSKMNTFSFLIVDPPFDSLKSIHVINKTVGINLGCSPDILCSSSQMVCIFIEISSKVTFNDELCLGCPNGFLSVYSVNQMKFYLLSGQYRYLNLFKPIYEGK